MDKPQVVSKEEWLQARKSLLDREKAFSRARDELSAQRRQLPWVEIQQDYQFDTLNGTKSLSDLFVGLPQLVIYHFMYGPDWEQGCPSCSFWADSFEGNAIHLAHRDISFVVVSRAPLTKLQAYRKRMGWSFDWVSSHDSSFNFDFAVSFTDNQMQDDSPNYNFATLKFPADEAPGFSVFTKNESGQIFHTYSTFSRGLDILNTAYNIIDLTPKGRNEAAFSSSMAWLRRHDQYE